MVNLADLYKQLNAFNEYRISRSDYRRSENVQYKAMHADMMRLGFYDCELTTKHVSTFDESVYHTDSFRMSAGLGIANKVRVMINNAAAHHSIREWTEITVSFHKRHVRIAFYDADRCTCRHVIVEKYVDKTYP